MSERGEELVLVLVCEAQRDLGLAALLGLLLQRAVRVLELRARCPTSPSIVLNASTNTPISSSVVRRARSVKSRCSMTWRATSRHGVQGVR